jgi:hypothetical protein
VIVWLAVVLWLVIVAWSLALMRAAGSADRGERGEGERGRSARRPAAPLRPGRRRVMVIGQSVLLGVVLVSAALLSTEEQWKPPAMVGLLAVLVLGSDFIVLDAKRFRIGGSFLGIVLAMALLGPAPAVLMGVAGATPDAPRPPPPGPNQHNNHVT